MFSGVSRVWPGVAVSVHPVMLCWCAWRQYFAWAVHDYMSILFAFMASMWGQCHAMCPGSWHWRHQSSSFDIMLTIEDGKMVAVSCAALSFYTSVMASFSVCGSFSLILAAKLCVFFSPLMKILIVACHWWNYSIWLPFWTNEHKLLVIPSPAVVYPWSMRCMCGC